MGNRRGRGGAAVSRGIWLFGKVGMPHHGVVGEVVVVVRIETRRGLDGEGGSGLIFITRITMVTMSIAICNPST